MLQFDRLTTYLNCQMKSVSEHDRTRTYIPST